MLNIYGYLVRRQSVVAVDRAVEHKTHRRRITPRREPIAGIPVPPAVVYEDDPVVVACPPTTIVPLPVVVAEHRILLAAERVAVPIVSDPGIWSTIISGGIRCLIDADISVSINRYVITPIRTATTINIGVSVAVRRYVSVAIDRRIPLARRS